jgi:hypothetical protein
MKNDWQLLKEGDPDGRYYMPAMSDAPLRGYNGATSGSGNRVMKHISFRWKT